MLKGLKLKIMVIAGLMLAFLCYSSFEARGQGLEMCPLSTDETGWFNLEVSFPLDAEFNPIISDFTSGLFGTVESLGVGFNIGGLDWLYNNDSDLNTNVQGTQVITWYSQANGRNSFIQLTNTNGADLEEDPICIGFCNTDNQVACDQASDCPGDPFVAECIFGVEVHVQIFDSNCLELINFCDFYTCADTHVYDLGNLVANNAANIPDVPDGTEGFLVATAVNECNNIDERDATCYNFLNGNLRMIDLDSSEIDYGTNVDVRQAIFLETMGQEDGEEVCLDEDTFLDLDGEELGLATKIPGEEDEEHPADLAHMFSLLPNSVGVPGSDLVLISVNDHYLPHPYTITPGLAIYSPTIFNANEEGISCTPFPACFIRLGLNSGIPNSDDFAPPTPTPTPTTPPTATPTSPPTATPTPTSPPGGGGGGCAIAGVSPVQLGTAMANVLIPLIPAFAIGYRILRRRARRNEK